MLEINKGFVDSISFKNNEKSITKSIVIMNRTVGMIILTESVKTKSQIYSSIRYSPIKFKNFYQ